eukprot:scaffold6439_cov167-Amphora_coffeaeformis.AAC.4
MLEDPPQHQRRWNKRCGCMISKNKFSFTNTCSKWQGAPATGCVLPEMWTMGTKTQGKPVNIVPWVTQLNVWIK